jgi:hypothetical protein
MRSKAAEDVSWDLSLLLNIPARLQHSCRSKLTGKRAISTGDVHSIIDPAELLNYLVDEPFDLIFLRYVHFGRDYVDSIRSGCE